MKKLYIILGIATLASCKPNIKSETPSANGLDFSNYVAVGNSLTAGYADGTLYRSGQVNSYPAILAEQFRLFGPNEFKQPLLQGEWGFPGPKLVLGYATDCLGATSLAPVPYTGTADTAGDNANIAAQGPFNNFGIPGIRAIDYLTPGYAVMAATFGFPYAQRMFTNPFARPIDELRLNNPTFFTLWLGSNDVLGYALSGGEGDPLPIHPNNISKFADFQAGYDSVLTTLTRNGAKGVLLNIPDVTSIPFFTTVPPNGLVLDTSQAAQLNAAYAGTGMSFRTGANPFVIEDLLAPAGRRQIRNGELILLSVPQDSMKCAGWGSARPIPKRFVLTDDEVAQLMQATSSFNSFISQQSINRGIPLADMNSFLKTVVTGYKFNGVAFTTQFISGGAFSLDGVHLTPRGYAVVANQVLQTINGFYKSTIPMIDANKYSGIWFPK